MTMPQRIRDINAQRQERVSRRKMDAAVPAAITSFLSHSPTATTRAIQTYLHSIGMKASISYIYGVKKSVTGPTYHIPPRATVPFRETKRRGRPRKQNDVQVTGISAAISLVQACNGDFEQVRNTIDLVQRVAEAKWA